MRLKSTTSKLHPRLLRLVWTQSYSRFRYSPHVFLHDIWDRVEPANNATNRLSSEVTKR